MASSTPKQMTNGNGTNNGPLGKRKKTRSSKGSYLNKWLDKTMSHIQESTPSMETYGSFVNSNVNWQNSQFAPGFDPCRFNLYACTEPMSLPTLPTYYNPAVFGPCPDYRLVQSENKSIQVQRPRQRRRSDHKAEEVLGTPLGTPNGTLKAKYISKYNESQDFNSLPPIVTSVGDTTSNSDMNTNEKEDGCRRYSDPCVQGLPDVARPGNGDANSDSDGSSDVSGSHVGSRLLACLLDQIRTLKLANERLNKDLQETKVELSSVKQQNAIWQKGSTASSLGGTPNHSMLNNNGLLNAGYSPGLLTDIVREIRDAARLREEAMYSRVRAMVHERTDNGLTAETKYSDRSLEDIKSSLRASEVDKRRMMLRINKLEEELRTLRITTGLSLEPQLNGQSNGNAEESDAELLRLRKECADMRRAKQSAEDQSHKLEMLVTQLRSKFKTQVSPTPNGPESLPSDVEHENTRVRRTSVNSTSNSTVVFGPVTDL